MKATLYLRIASVLTLIHAVLHTVGGVFGKTPAGPASVAVAAMQANRFVFMGANRTLWEFHRGMGLAVTIFLTVDAIVFWILASLARKGERASLAALLPVFAFGYIAFAIVSAEYFFTLPVVFEGIIACCLIMGWRAARRQVGVQEGKKTAAV